MRKCLLLIFLVALATAVPASGDTVQSLQGSFGTGKTGQATSLSFTQQTVDTSASKALRADKGTWLLPAGAVIEIRAAAYCKLTVLQLTGACPASSKIGTGNAKMDVRAASFNQVEGQVTAYNAQPAKAGRGQVGRLLLQVSDPTSGNKTVLVGKITKGETQAPYGYAIKFDSFPSPPFDTSAQVVYNELKVSLTAKRRRKTKTMGTVTYNYIVTSNRCAGGSWYFQGLFRMENKALLKPANAFSCT